MALCSSTKTNPKEANLFGGKVRYGAMAVGSAVTDRIHTRPGLWPHAAGDGLGHHKQRRIVCSSQSTYRIEYNMGSVPRKPSGAVGYLSGYVTYAEALAMVQPAAETLCSRYSNWKQLQKDYLEGYMKWAGLNGNVWTTERGKLYDTILNDPNMNGVFDNTLFRNGCDRTS